MERPPGPEAPAFQRADGRAELRFELRGGRSRLAHLAQRHPCRILFPESNPGEPPLAVMATLSGGLTGGDRVRLAIEAGEDASLSATTQAAELIYRSNGPDCGIEAHLAVEPGAWMDWLPWPTILFNGARLRRRTTVSVAEGGRLLACECLIFGRAARGETFASGGALRDEWRITCGNRPVWIDSFHLTGDIEAAFASPFRLNGAGAVAAAFYVADEAPEFLDLARKLTDAAEGRAGATLVNGVLLARFLHASPDFVRRDLDAYCGALREAVGPYSSILPRVGHRWA